MNTVAVILVIFFGAGHSSAFDTIRFDTMEQCEAARTVIAEEYKDDWSGKPDLEHMKCLEVKR